MALVVDATAKGASSNSYLTQADATTYLEGRVNATAWTTATSTQKDQAIVSATERLEQEQWVGFKTTDTQRLKWPRYGVTDEDGRLFSHETIPLFLQRATAELALALLQDTEHLDMTGAQNIQSASVGPLSVSYRTQQEKIGNLPPQVRRFVQRYLLSGPNAIPIFRG